LTLSELRWAILVDLGYLTDYAEQQVRDHLGESSKRRVLTLEELAQELAKLPSQQREEVYAMVEDILGSV
jgi:DNA-directed RNA polymerase specialized sigma24 family protein